MSFCTGGHGHSHLAVTSDDDAKEGGGGPAKHASQMNMRGVFLHVLADALGSVVVIISALIMWLTEWEYKLYVDPGDWCTVRIFIRFLLLSVDIRFFSALSLCLVLLMLYSVWPLLMESALILLQTVPTHIQVTETTTFGNQSISTSYNQ